MKTTMTKKIITVAVLSTLSLTTLLKAEDILIPAISRPEMLQEGTEKGLTPTQIAELLPWAKDSKFFLVDLLDATRSLPTLQRIDRLLEGVKQVVGESSPKHSELFMRYILNRAIALNALLSHETDADAVGSSDAKSRVLSLSIEMAIRYYDIDMAKLSKNKSSSYAGFGMDYFNFLNEINKSVFDASAQYHLARTSLEWLQWDLYRDLNNTAYAPKIVKIYNALKIFPTTAMPDNQSLNYIRQMKKIAQQLGITPAPNENENENENRNDSVTDYAMKYTYYYSAETLGGRYYGGCYEKAKNGSIIWDSRVDLDKCLVKKVAYFYESETPGSRYYSGCYQYTTNNKVHWDARVAIDKCKIDEFEYVQSKDTPGGRYYAGCYQRSITKGKIMWSENRVDNSHCK